jgi:hypothetical protein
MVRPKAGKRRRISLFPKGKRASRTIPENLSNRVLGGRWQEGNEKQGLGTWGRRTARHRRAPASLAQFVAEWARFRRESEDGGQGESHSDR